MKHLPYRMLDLVHFSLTFHSKLMIFNVKTFSFISFVYSTAISMILFIQLSSQNWCIWLKYTSYCSEILANGLLCKLSAYAFNACLISIYAFIIIDVCCKVLKCQSVHRLAFNVVSQLLP